MARLRVLQWLETTSRIHLECLHRKLPKHTWTLSFSSTLQVMASKGTDQVEGPRCFQGLEDVEILNFPARSIPLENRSLQSNQADPRAKNQAQSTRAQNKAQNTRAQNKALSTRAQNKAQGTRAQNQSQHTQAKNGLRAHHAPQAQDLQGQEADKDGCSTEVSYCGVNEETYLTNKEA